MKRSTNAAALIALGLGGCVHYVAAPLVPETTAAALESRSLTDPGLRAFLEEEEGHPLTEWPPARWNPRLLTLVAFYYSPDLDVARARWRTSRAAVLSAGTRPNPTLSVTPEFSTNPPAGMSAWLPVIALDVPIETAGKRRHRVSQADYLAESARWSVVTTAWEVRRRVTAALLADAVSGRREQLLSRQVDLQAQIVRWQEGASAAGAAADSDVVLARVQLAKTRIDLEAARAQAADSRTRVAEALGVPSRSLDGVDWAFDFDVADASSLTTAAARRNALRGRSDVRGEMSAYEASQAALQLEIAKQYPDLHVGPGYQWDQGQNVWLLSLTLDIPLFNRHEGPIAEAVAHRAEAAARFMALQSEVIHQIDAAVSALHTAEQASLAGEALLAVQRQGLEARQAELKAGAVGALEITSAELDATNAETLAFEANVRRQQATLMLENAIQLPLGSPAESRAAALQIESSQRAPR